MKRIAFYGGSFDPVHLGHLAIARELIRHFSLDEFVFIPAFHAPHKLERKPTSAFHRFAMLCVATNDDLNIKVSTIEIELPEKPFTVETLPRLKAAFTNTEIFFVMGADSWQDILTWREWEKVLLMTNHIVVSRPGYEIGFAHVSDVVRDRIVDLRGNDSAFFLPESRERHIFITDAVNMQISATAIRRQIRESTPGWRDELSDAVAKYIEKYQIYK
jgi:nicotinate-nucleotide adenylyltransferase